jgi:hypothetical protein
MFNMKPVIKPQPDSASYPIDTIFLFTRLTRPIYKDLFGEEAPPYDPSKPIKRWGDTTKLVNSDGTPVADPENELCAYNVWDEVKGAVIKKVMTNADAAAVNLPGIKVYPKWDNPATSAAVLVDPVGSSQINGTTLISWEDALKIQKEITTQLNLNATIVEQDLNSDGFYKVIWGSETRRSYNLIIAGKDPMNMGALGKSRWAAGYDVPGKWVLNNVGYPSFVADVQTDGMQDPRPEVPFPVRNLYSNEKIVLGFGGIAHIERTDKGSTTPSTGTGGGLTADQDAKLSQIAYDVKSIKALMQTNV